MDKKTESLGTSDIVSSLERKLEAYEEALKKIANRKMSMYLSKDDMLNDFINIAAQALKTKH